MAIENTPTTHQPIDNTQNVLPIENEQLQPGIKYDTSLENKLSNMKNHTGFFNIEERKIGDIIWNGFPNEKMGGIKLKIIEKIYDTTPGNQKVLTDLCNIPLKKLNDQDREILINVLESVNFENYKAIFGESKSGRY